MKCCGANGPYDWASAKYNNKGESNIFDLKLSNVKINFEIPPSCCKEEVDTTTCEVSRKLGIGAKINPALYTEVSFTVNEIPSGNHNNVRNIDF